MPNDGEVKKSSSKKSRRSKTKDKTSSGSHWFVVYLTTRYAALMENACKKTITDLKEEPAKTIKALSIKFVMFIWCVVVLLSICNLIGVPIYNPMTSLRSLSSSTNGDDDTLALDEGQAPSEGGDDDFDEEDLKQKLPASSAQKPKYGKKQQVEAACKELVCIDKCVAKGKPKCLKSKSCRTERHKICGKRCRKARCEERCADEVKMAYVEREQKMDQCKESCQGSTAVHNKCIKKCHSEFKPCKTKCYEQAHKYSCDNIPTSLKTSKAAPIEPESASEEEDMDDDGDDTSSQDDEDSDDIIL